MTTERQHQNAERNEPRHHDNQILAENQTTCTHLFFIAAPLTDLVFGSRKL